MILAPAIEGILPLRSSPAAFIRALRDPVAAGLLGTNVPRSRYVISESTADMMRIHATNWQTAVNVGLNEAVRDPCTIEAGGSKRRPGGKRAAAERR